MPIIRAEDIAQRANCSLRTVEAAIARGELTPIRVEKRRRFDPEQVAKWIEGRNA